MQISELSARTGTSRRALRYYEEQGLLTPDRLPNGYRDYDEQTVTTVRRIQILLSAGLGTSAIAEILPCVIDENVVLAGRCPELLDGLAKERERITSAIEELTEARHILDNLVGRPLIPEGRPAN
ncbi:MerR family transcriptional regulator [Marinactinospora rubrisoli]|uniref:MerR family transcriptional regulator n=1 Tax=Marinactinospora rubrisoli TaxID=2715399 RepID=A0ABW2KF45_9ACTN